MAWNKNGHFTTQEYATHVQFHARESLFGKHIPIIHGSAYPPFWWITREIRVFSDPSISMKAVDTIIAGIQERTDEIGLAPFSFRFYGNHESAAQQVQESLVRGQLDYEKLFKIAASEIWRDDAHGGAPHGDIYITTRSFLDDPASWAAADFAYGAMVFLLCDNRWEDLEFLRKVALHETNHLLGMHGHCDDYQNVDGFSYSPQCNMHWNCIYAELCPKCLFFLKNWWIQIEHQVSIHS